MSRPIYVDDTLMKMGQLMVDGLELWKRQRRRQKTRESEARTPSTTCRIRKRTMVIAVIVVW